MRSRNIKPGFFKNEVLAGLPIEARLLFVGLWLLADREGRLEDRPKRISAELFPYDDKFKIENYLRLLSTSGFIHRYGDSPPCIQILKFKLHQNPHKNEIASVLPAPGDIGTLPEPSTTITGATRADSLLLIPSSLIPSSLIPDSLYAATPQREDAGTLTAFYIDAMRSAQQVLTDADKGQFARYAGQVLKQGCVYQDAINATRKMVEKGLAPRLLGQLVNEVRAGSKMPANVAAALKIVQECEEGA